MNYQHDPQVERADLIAGIIVGIIFAAAFGVIISFW